MSKGTARGHPSARMIYTLLVTSQVENSLHPLMNVYWSLLKIMWPFVSVSLGCCPREDCRRYCLLNHGPWPRQLSLKCFQLTRHSLLWLCSHHADIIDNTTLTQFIQIIHFYYCKSSVTHVAKCLRNTFYSRKFQPASCYIFSEGLICTFV